MSDLLRKKRKSLGLTVTQMGDRLNMCKSTIGYYETNKRLPDIRKVMDIKEAYRLTDEELLQWLEEIRNV